MKKLFVILIMLFGLLACKTAQKSVEQKTESTRTIQEIVKDTMVQIKADSTY